PGRSCHDAIGSIFNAIRSKAKFVFDADIAGCFDSIGHQALLEKLQTYPAMRQAIKGWLKAGAMDHGIYRDTMSGVPQGGVISPVLMNVALHGLEKAIEKGCQQKGRNTEKPIVIRYADDVRHFTQHEILLAEKRGSEDDDLWVISPTWRRKPKGKGACEKRGKRVKALKRCPARPA